ncbi:MAG TPA: Ig domain-containing protein [Azoarcus taiwanensis]|nr:Ig domain-containing protein [Azoarcus taiwanensis]
MGHSIGNAVRSLVLVGSALVLAACGGGGGGGGGADIPENSYRVSISSARTQLPLKLDTNECRNPPNAFAPYATVVNISAARRLSGDPIPEAEDNVFVCNVAAGLEVGALYYFRGRDEEQREIPCTNPVTGETEDVKIEASFRNITLGSSAGGNSFHVLGGNRVGEVVINCTATDPVSGDRATGQHRIQVGGASSGRASQVAFFSAPSQEVQDPDWMLVQGLGDPTQKILQVRVVDEAGQAVPNPPVGVANLLARIVPNPGSLADNDALLRSGGQSGKSVAVSTINGQAQFTVVSGNAPGAIVVEFFADRADGNVLNGITEPIYNAISVPVFDSTVFDRPLVLVTEELPRAFLSTPYAQILEVTGGRPPYAFSLASGTTLPVGLSLSANGVIGGTPLISGGNFGFIIRVTDALGRQTSRAFTLDVEATGGADIPPPPLAISTTSLPSGTAGQPYTAILQAQGGAIPYTWSQVGVNAGGFAVGGTGIGAVTAAVALAAGTYSVVAQVTDADGRAVARTFTITINNP